jgi:hypothetical protein
VGDFWNIFPALFGFEATVAIQNNVMDWRNAGYKAFGDHVVEALIICVTQPFVPKRGLAKSGIEYKGGGASNSKAPNRERAKQ